MAYWITSLALIIFGFLGSLSIGQPLSRSAAAVRTDLVCL